jgi:hypothetical protein
MSRRHLDEGRKRLINRVNWRVEGGDDEGGVSARIVDCSICGLIGFVSFANLIG